MQGSLIDLGGLIYEDIDGPVFRAKVVALSCNGGEIGKEDRTDSATNHAIRKGVEADVCHQLPFD